MSREGTSRKGSFLAEAEKKKGEGKAEFKGVYHESRPYCFSRSERAGQQEKEVGSVRQRRRLLPH